MNTGRSPFKIVLLAIAATVSGCFAVAGQSTNGVQPNDFSSFRIISDRNIFDPNRRPRMVSGPAPTIVDSFSLTGTLDYAKGKFAVFDGTSSDYHKVLEAGGRIAGYTVTEISRDTVKLAAGTNVLELRVGTQMRRDDNGHWSAGESAEPIEHSYASNSSRNESGRRRFNAESNRNRAPSSSQSAVVPSASAAAAPDQSGDSSDTGTTAAPSPAASTDPNDPIARMMARRLQETGGGGNGNDNRNSNQ
jgi:hypothetical protein